MPPWSYKPAADFGQSWIERLRRFPRSADMSVWGLQSLTSLALRGYLKAYHRLSIDGVEHLNQREAFVLVANHASHLDALCLMGALPWAARHRVFAAAASDYWFRRPSGVIVAAGMLNALAMDRQGNPRKSLNACRLVLDRPGNVLILFPEGRRSPDGQMLPFRPGIGFLLAGTAHPVVPAYISGTERALPRGRAIPVPHPIRVRFGPPCRFPNIQANRDGYEQVTREVEQAIRRLRPSEPGTGL